MLTNYLTELHNLLQAIYKTLRDISNISIIFVVFLLTYTLLGMEMFAYKAKFNSNNQVDLSSSGLYPNSNFNTFFGSVLSVFVVIANDGWAQIFINHYRVAEHITTSLYFTSLLAMGQFVLLNLFIAILIENFNHFSLKNDMNDRLLDIASKSLKVKIYDFICRKKKTRINAEKILSLLIRPEEQERQIQVENF